MDELTEKQIEDLWIEIDDYIYFLMKRTEYRHNVSFECSRDAINKIIREMYSMKEKKNVKT